MQFDVNHTFQQHLNLEEKGEIASKFGEDISFQPRILFVAELTILKLSEITIKPFLNIQVPPANDHL